MTTCRICDMWFEEHDKVLEATDGLPYSLHVLNIILLSNEWIRLKNVNYGWNSKVSDCEKLGAISQPCTYSRNKLFVLGLVLVHFCTNSNYDGGILIVQLCFCKYIKVSAGIYLINQLHDDIYLYSVLSGKQPNKSPAHMCMYLNSHMFINVKSQTFNCIKQLYNYNKGISYFISTYFSSSFTIIGYIKKY